MAVRQMVTPLFFYVYLIPLLTSIAESQMPKNLIRMANKLQRYVSQPTDDGRYEIAVFRDAIDNYVALTKEVYLTKEEADKRALELNQQYRADDALKEGGSKQ